MRLEIKAKEITKMLKRASLFFLVAISSGQVCLAQNALSRYLFDRGWTPITDHSTQLIPGAIIEVSLRTGNLEVWPPSPDQSALLMDHFTGALDQSQEASITDVNAGLSGVTSLFGSAFSGIFQNDSTISFSGMSFDSYSLAWEQEKRLLGNHAGSVYKKIDEENDTHKVAYFLVTTIASASHAEITSTKAVGGGIALGEAKNGSCKVPAAPTAVPKTVGEMQTAVDNGAHETNLPPSKGRYIEACKGGNETVIFDSKMVVPVAMKVKLVTVFETDAEDELDTDYAEPTLATWDKPKLAKQAKDLIKHAYAE